MPRILIAEDEEVVREFLEHILRKEGFTPVLAADGEMALALAKEERPDLVLMDVLMPHMDGFEVLRRLKDSPELSSIPVIMLTAKGADTDIMIGFDMGVTDYLPKPFSPVELLARVRRALRDTGVTGSSVAGD
jgi:DNA-binding response OmpR family regulator